ncbi:MAG: hypothetical protein Kow00121_67530 [Elainellaceae cyanobacterium]
MIRRIAFWSLWAWFVGHAFLFAPPNHPDTLTQIQNLSTGQWQGINPLVVALFNIMGVLPLLYGCFLFSDGKMQKVRAWPFAAASFAVGAFALLPYLALRHPNPTFIGEKNGWLKLWDSRWLGVLIASGAIVLLGYGITQGDWSNFAYQWQTSRFIHVMSLDFCLLCLLLPALLGDDMKRRGLDNIRLFWAVALIPLLGPLAYVVLRPPLPESNAAPTQSAVSAQL